MRILVTGGAGFIGSHVAEALLERGDEVVIVDDLSTGHRENVPQGARLVVGDLADEGVADGAVDGCSAVIHCAALPSVTLSVERPVASLRANLEASTRLLLACRDRGVTRVVYSSSSAVYGSRVRGVARETRREGPVSPYGMNKLAAEHLFRMAPALYDVDTFSLRYFNVYGPRQDPSSPYSGVVSIFITRALDGQPPTIHGDGLQSRDFTYVSDVVAANLAALAAPRGRGRVVNVARGGSINLLELWEAVRRVCGRPDLGAHFGPARPGDIRHSRAATGRAHRWLGFTAGVPLERGLEQTVAWYRGRPSSQG
jgi:UDP-glucose 4-epimerase